MPFVFNGVTIPENIANKLYFNGVNITDVFFNGVQVWNQALFAGVWSGNSMTPDGAYGMQVSGASFRYYNQYIYTNGTWLVASSPGVFTNGYSGTSPTTGQGLHSGGYHATSANGMAIINSVLPTGQILYTTATGFTGNSVSSNFALETSGGAMRVKIDTNYGAWVTLT